jgi:hypothetical protein
MGEKSIQSHPYLRGTLRVLIFLFGITAMVFLSPPIQQKIENRMLLFREYLIAELENRIQRKISYAAVSPSIFRAFEVSNLQIRDEKTGRRLVEADRLRVHYNLFGLLFGHIDEAVREIVLENASVNFDADLDAGLLELFRGDSEEMVPRKERDYNARVRITGRNIRLHLSSGSEDLVAEKMFFQIRPGRDGYDLRLKSSLTYTNSAENQILRRGGAAVDLRGVVGASLARGEAALGLSQLTTDIFDMKKQVFQISFSPDGLRLQKIQDSSPLDFSLVYKPASRDLRIVFLSRRFTPASLVTMKSDFAFLNEWLETALSCEGSLSYKLSDGQLRYGLDFDADVNSSGLPPGAHILGRLEGTQSSVSFLPLTLTGPFGSASFTGDMPFSTYYPAGNLSMENFTLAGPQPVNALLRVIREAGGVTVSAQTASWGTSVYRDLLLRMELSARGLRVDGSMGFESAEDAGARLFFLLPFTDEASQFSVQMEDVPAGVLRTPLENFFPKNKTFASLYSLPDKENLRIQGALIGENGPEGISFDLSRCVIFRAEDRENYRITVSGNYGAGHWEIGGWDFRWGSYYGRGNAAGDVSAGGRVDFTSAVNIMDIPYSFGGTLDPDGYLHIDGSYGMTADISWRPWGDYTGFFTLQEFPVPVLYDVMKISSIMHFRYADPGSWGVSTNIVRITGFSPFPHIKADISFAFDLGPGGGKLMAVEYSDSVSTLRGGGELSYTLNPLDVQANVQLSAGEASVERYSAGLSFHDESAAGKIVFTDVPLERFSDQNIAGKLSGLIDFEGLPQNPRVRLSLDFPGGRVQGRPASLRFDGKLENRTVSVSALEVSYSGFSLSDTLVECSLDEGNLSLAAILRQKTDPGEIMWFLGGGLRFADGEQGGGEGLSLERFINSDISGQFQFSTPSAQVAQEFRGWNFFVEKQGRNTRLSGGYNDSLNIVFRDSGDFSVTLKEPFPLAFEAEGIFTGDEIEANINKISFKVEDFSWLFDFGILHLRRGNASGNLRIYGSPLDPDIYGTVAVMDGYAGLEVVPEELGPYRGNIIFREKEFAVQPMLVPVGAGSAVVSADFLLDKWMPVSLSVLIDTQESAGVHIVSNFNGLLVDGMAQGVLRINGDPRRINIDGDITASHTIITTGDPPETAPGTSDAIYTSVGMRIEAGSGVEMLLPTRDFPILQTYANRGEKINIVYDGETADYHILGNVAARGGEIFWFDRRFFIREGEARFDERSGSFDPLVAVRAELRETTTDGLVRIYLVSDLTPASQFFPRFESDRGYTDAEILAVLGNNPFGTSGEEALNIASAVPFTGEILTQIGVIKTVEKNIRDTFNLDLFSIRTHVVQNLLQGVVTPTREQETELQFRERNIPSFGRYLDKTSLFLGKYIGSDLFLNFLLQLRAEDILAREEDAFGGLVLDAEFILEWQTPFFLLEWALMPKHPNELFIFDNVFTFRWRFAF